MRFLVDTSVWSLALRRRRPVSHPAVDKLKILLEAGEDVCLMGVILTEVLQGFRAKGQSVALKKALEPFPLLEMDREGYVEAADIRNECAARGVQVSTIDGIIAASAIRHRAHLLTADNDFVRMSKITSLKLA